MKITLVNIAHPSIGSRIPDDHLPPLGLLSLGGPLLDAGHAVSLIDGDLECLAAEALAHRARAADVVMLGHSGSTSAHPAVVAFVRALQAVSQAIVVYGGVFPTYHWREILTEEPGIDVIVRGEGENTAVALVERLVWGLPLAGLPGIAYREQGAPIATPNATTITDLDTCRIGWELIDHRRYTYWGGKRAVVVQFSRGCPFRCTYCGQHAYWTTWRHRDPVRFAAEIARLHREQGVEVFNFADENPTANREAWRAFCEALVAEGVKVTLVGSTRAGDIVRDADLLPLYAKAGVTRFLLGTEATDEATLKRVRKGSTVTVDREAIRLLRTVGILSMATWVAGLGDQSDADYFRGLRQLLSYDPDQVQLLYATPHRWTPFYATVKDHRVVQPNAAMWDYKHQVLAGPVPPWRVLAWVKLMEVTLQARPRAIARTLAHPDPHLRAAMQWYAQMGRRVWPYEIRRFMQDSRSASGPTVAELWGEPQVQEAKALRSPGRGRGASMEPTMAAAREQAEELVGGG